jgi:hypothetical protein
VNPHRESPDQSKAERLPWGKRFEVSNGWVAACCVVSFTMSAAVMVQLLPARSDPSVKREPVCTESVLQFAARPGPDVLTGSPPIVDMTCKPGQRLELLKDRAMVVCHCDHESDPSPSEIMEWRVRMASVDGLMQDTRARLQQIEEDGYERVVVDKVAGIEERLKKLESLDDNAYIAGKMTNHELRLKKLEEKRP